MSTPNITIQEAFYEGKAKVLHNTSDPALIVQFFKDDATAFNRQKIGSIEGKGTMNLRIASALFKIMQDKGIPTHFVAVLSEREMLCKRVQIVPLEVVVRRKVAGTFAKRYGIEEGTALAHPIVEFFYKDDALGDPLVTAEAAEVVGWASAAELQQLDTYARQVCQILYDFFLARGVELIDFKLEFGRLPDGTLLLADEISPDSCRLWEVGTGKKLDKDRFRRDLGGVAEAYADILARVEG
jgi:phosphoribosylaminoimidazole-succinocarboxamide synthase